MSDVLFISVVSHSRVLDNGYGLCLPALRCGCSEHPHLYHHLRKNDKYLNKICKPGRRLPLIARLSIPFLYPLTALLISALRNLIRSFCILSMSILLSILPTVTNGPYMFVILSPCLIIVAGATGAV